MTPDTLHAAAANPSVAFQLMLMIVSALGLAVGTLATILIKMLSSRFSRVEHAVEALTRELSVLDKAVSSGYVTRPELQSEMTKVLNAMRDDRKEIVDALKEVTAAMANTVRRDECIRMHGNGGHK